MLLASEDIKQKQNEIQNHMWQERSKSAQEQE